MDKQLCSQAYKDVIEYSARIACYATSNISEQIGHGHYESRARELAVRDVIILCISVRRLAELTKTFPLLKKYNFMSCTPHRRNESLEFDESDHSLNLLKVINGIIHSNLIYIASTDEEFYSIFQREEDGIRYLYDRVMNRKSITPILIIKSDRGFLAPFQLFRFVHALISYSDEADDVLADNNIFVGQLYE